MGIGAVVVVVMMMGAFAIGGGGKEVGDGGWTYLLCS